MIDCRHRKCRRRRIHGWAWSVSWSSSDPLLGVGGQHSGIRGRFPIIPCRGCCQCRITKRARFCSATGLIPSDLRLRHLNGRIRREADDRQSCARPLLSDGQMATPCRPRRAHIALDRPASARSRPGLICSLENARCDRRRSNSLLKERKAERSQANITPSLAFGGSSRRASRPLDPQ
jgi:hypothetical protein